MKEATVGQLLEEDDAVAAGILFATPRQDITSETDQRSLKGLPQGPRVATVGSPQEEEALLPKEHQDFEDVFSEKNTKAMPENTHVQHAIDLVEGKEVPYGPIYPLSGIELKTLRDYIDASLAKG